MGVWRPTSHRCANTMDSPIDDEFREESRCACVSLPLAVSLLFTLCDRVRVPSLRDDELADAPRTPVHREARDGSPLSSGGSDVLSPAQRKKRAAIARKKEMAKARKSERKAAAERERAEAEAAARLAEKEEAEAEAAEAAAAKEAADVEAAERDLEAAQASGDATATAAAEERLARERAEAAAAKDKARRERAEAKAARDRAEKEAAEAEAAEAALEQEQADEETIRVEEDKAARRTQMMRDETAHERERKIALLRKDEVEALKLDTAESKKARQQAHALHSVRAQLKLVHTKHISAEKALAQATESSNEDKAEDLTDQLAALREQLASLVEQEQVAAREAESAAQASKQAAEDAAKAKKSRENAEERHALRLRQDEIERDEEIRKLLEGRANREEARLEARAAAEEQQLETEAAIDVETLESERSAAKDSRDKGIQRLRRAEVDAENLLDKANTEAREKKDAYNSAATKSKGLQANVAEAKSALAAAHEAEELTGIADAEARLTELEAQAKAVAAQTILNKTELEQAETAAKTAGKEVARVQAERKAAEQQNADLVKQAEKEIAAAEKQRAADKNARNKKREKEKARRKKGRAKSYAADKARAQRAAAEASVEAAANRETRDVERAFLALLRAREGGNPATISAAEKFLANVKADAAAAAKKAEQDRAAAAKAAKEAEAADKARSQEEKRLRESKRQEAKRQAKLKRAEAVEKERREEQLAQARVNKENRDVEQAEAELMDARKSKDTHKIEQAEANLVKETREAHAAAMKLERERDDVIQVLVDHEAEAREKERVAKEKADTAKHRYELAAAKLKTEQRAVAKAERKLEETMASGDADATKDAEEFVLKEIAEANEAAQLAANEAKEAKQAAVDTELAAQEAAEDAAACTAERVLADKQREKLQQLEQKLKESMIKKEMQMQKAAMRKLGEWLRGRGYSLHLHELVNKLSTDGHQRGHPPGSGWIRILEQWPPQDFENYMVDIHGDEDWQATQASQRRAAYSSLQHPMHKTKTGIAHDAHRRVEMEMKGVANARSKHERTRMAVEQAELELKNAEVVGNKDAMQAAEARLPKLREEHAEAAAILEKEQKNADEAQAELSEALRPTKSHPIEPVRVTAHGRELSGRAKPPAPRLLRADSAELLYDPPRVAHSDKSPWLHPTVTERQRRERENDTLSKSMEDSVANSSIASKDETLDRSYEKDERDYLDLSGFTKPRRRGVVVSVMACRNLRKADLFGKNDPYVKVRVGGDEQKTTVIDDGGSDPTWGENGHRMEFFPTLEGFPVIKVKTYDDDFGPEALADDLLGKCEIDMARLKLQLWESSEVRGWFPLVLKGKDCGAVELKIGWEPHPPLPDELGVRARVGAARRRTRKNCVYRDGHLVDHVASHSYSSNGLDATIDEAGLKEELSGKWRARGTLDDNRPTPSTRPTPGLNSSAWLETVGQEEEEFELSVDEGGNLFGRPLRDIDPEDDDFFEMAGKLRMENASGEAGPGHEADETATTEENLSLSRRYPSKPHAREPGNTSQPRVRQRWRIMLTQLYPATGNKTEWSAIVSSDGKRMEDGEWNGSGISGQFSARRLCRSEADSSTRSVSGRNIRPAREELAKAESRHARCVQAHGPDHPSSLQAQREKAEVMRAHGNLEGYQIEIRRVEEMVNLQTRKERWERYDPSSILNSQPQFSPAPSAVLPPTVGREYDDDADQTAAMMYIDESVPELRLSPEREPAPEPFHDVEPDHIAAIIDVEGESSLIASPSARYGGALVPGLDELLGSDDESRSTYNGGDV